MPIFEKNSAELLISLIRCLIQTKNRVMMLETYNNSKNNIEQCYNFLILN